MEQQRAVPAGFRHRRGRAAAPVERLEDRRLFCGYELAGVLAADSAASDASPAAPASPTAASAPPPLPASVPLSPSGVPLLHSLPGAPAAVFLDFDGYGSYGPYDTDGDPSAFGEGEQSEIAEAWRQVASYFSMLNLDVTTEPPLYPFPFSYTLISNDIAIAQNLGNFPAVSPINFNTSSQATTRPSALAHEIGHSLGLQHQSIFDRQGNKTDEYSGGYDVLHGPIMGLDYAQDVHKWFIGHPSSSPLLLQDDLAVMAATLKPYTGGDGFRPDDLPDTLPQAQPIPSGPAGGAASGIIERLSDRDAFSFTSAGGRVALDLVPPAPSMLDCKLEVYAADGTLIAAADGPENDQHVAFLALPGGTYYAVVSSHGDYADVGPYELTVVETDADDVPPPVYNTLPAPTGLTLAAGEGTGIDLRWDAVAGATGYAIDWSDDGIGWTHAGTTAGAAATSFVDDGSPGGRRSFYRVSADDDSGRSPPSDAASLVNRPAAVSGLSFTNWRSERFVLNWADVSGEGGYRVERRTESGVVPAAWTLMAQPDANVPSFTDRTIVATTRYRYRVTATSPRGDAAPAEVVAAPPLVSVDNLHVTNRLPTWVRLAWNPIGGAVGYSVERSDDGINYVAIRTTTSPFYDDTSVQPVNKYYYRVIGTNDLGESAPSAAVVTATPPLAGLPAGWIVWDIGGASSGAAGTLAHGAAAFGPAPDTLSVIGGGRGTIDSASVNGSSDSFRFVYRRMPGNSTVTAHVASLVGPPGRNATAGVMIRDSESPGDVFVFAGLDGDGVAGVQSRLRDGGRGTEFDPIDFGEPISWFRLVRTGSIIKLWVASGAGEVWRLAGSFTVSFTATPLVGLVASAGGDDQLSEAVFGNVSVSANRAPTFIESPAADPAVVDGNQTQLSVLATDDGGEDNLVYDWSVVSAPAGARPPSFSDNDTNDAKSVPATFFQAGDYLLRATVTNALQFSSSSDVTVQVLPTLTAIVVSPRGVAVHAGSDFAFAAVPLDQFGMEYVPPAPQPPAEVEWTGYYGQVRADGSYNSGEYSGWDTVGASYGGLSESVDFFVYDDSGPALLSAASRKTHGRRGAFDLPLALYGLPVAVEPRRGGPSTLRFTFSEPVVSDDGSLGADNFYITGATYRAARVAGSVLTLDLAGVKDESAVSVSLTGLIGTDGGRLQGETSLDVRAVFGDVDRDGTVTAADFFAIRRRALRLAGATDFLCDIDLNGMITAADLLAVRRRIIATVPV